jgi:carbon starvation protein
MVLVPIVLADSIRVWVGILRGTREAQIREAPFVISQLQAEEL